MKAWLFVLAGLLAGPAAALQYDTLVAEETRIGFIYRQMSVPVEGAFRQVGGSLVFDPARPETTRGEITVAVGAIDTGSPEGDEEARGRLWVDALHHPVARFVVQKVKATGADRFEVGGTLTIKGRSRALVLPVTVRTSGRRAVAETRFVLRRLDFAVGEGLWADVSTVANEVEVRVRLVLAASSSS